MARSIIGVIVGYLALAIVIFGAFTGAYLILGADGSFQPGNYKPSPTWVAVSFVTALFAALAAGFVCALISRGGKAVYVLTAIVALYAIGEGVYFTMNPKPDPGPRTAEVGNMEAMMKAQTPAWLSFGNGVMALLFIPVGGRLRRKPATTPR